MRNPLSHWVVSPTFNLISVNHYLFIVLNYWIITYTDVIFIIHQLQSTTLTFVKFVILAYCDECNITFTWNLH